MNFSKIDKDSGYLSSISNYVARQFSISIIIGALSFSANITNYLSELKLVNECISQLFLLETLKVEDNPDLIVILFIYFFIYNLIFLKMIIKKI